MMISKANYAKRVIATILVINAIHKKDLVSLMMTPV